MLELNKPGLAVAPLEQAVGLDPTNAEGYYNLGRALSASGRNEPAANAFTRSLELRPDFAPAYHELGVLMLNAGVPEQATECFQLALQFDPQDADAAFRLGTLEQDGGNFGKALEWYSKAVDIDPEHASAHVNLGTIASRFDKLELAIKSFRKAVAIEPKNAPAYSNLAKCQREIGDLEGSAESARKALELNPNLAEAHNNLGNSLKDQGLLEESVKCFERARSLDSSKGAVFYNLADAYHQLRLYDLALENFRRAIELQPDLARAWNNMGLVLADLARYEDALRSFEKAVELEPEHHGYKCSMSRALYMLGRLEESFELAHHCFIAGLRKPYRRFNIPLWRGEPLADKRLLVWREQGLGDEIIFSQWYCHAIEDAKNVVIEADPRMVSLFKRTYPKATVKIMDASNDLSREDADYHIYAGGLEEFYADRTETGVLPQAAIKPDFVLDERKSKKWRDRLTALGDGLKVGICWRSRLSTRLRDPHYSNILDWEPLFRLSGVQFVNLQYDDCREALEEVRENFGTTVHVWDDLDLKDDLDDVFALIGELDLVITAKTAVSAIADALATPCWSVYLGAPRPQEPPRTHARLRQTLWARHASEDWKVLFERVANVLENRLREDGGALLSADAGERARRLAFGLPGKMRARNRPNTIQVSTLDRLFAAVEPSVSEALLEAVLSAEELKETTALDRNILASIGAIARFLQPNRTLAIGPSYAAVADVLKRCAPEGALVLAPDFNIRYGEDAPTSPGPEMPGEAPLHVWDATPKEMSRLWGLVREASGTGGATGSLDRWEGSVDLIFISLALRTYEEMEAETAMAFRLLSPRGVVLWCPFTTEEGAGSQPHIHHLLDVDAQGGDIRLRHLEGLAMVAGSHVFEDDPGGRVVPFGEVPAG